MDRLPPTGLVHLNAVPLKGSAPTVHSEQVTLAFKALGQERSVLRYSMRMRRRSYVGMLVQLVEGIVCVVDERVAFGAVDEVLDGPTVKPVVVGDDVEMDIRMGIRQAMKIKRGVVWSVPRTPKLRST